MTTLLAAFLLAQSGPKAIELSDTSPTSLAQVHLMSEEDDPALPVLGRLVAEQSGAKVVVLPGMMRVEWQGDRKLAAEGVTGLCRSVSSLLVDESNAEEALQHTRVELGSYVVQARWGSDPVGSGDPDQLLSASLSHATAPGSFFVVGQGDFGSQGLQGLVTTLPWPTGRKPVPGSQHPLGKVNLPEGVEAIQWRGASLRPGTVEWTAAFLATCALGSGPGGLLTEVCRTRNAWSYDQDAVMWPTRNGYGAVVTVFRKSGSDVKVEEVNHALDDAIDHMTEADRSRALHLAKLAIEGDERWSPLLMSPTAAYRATLSDKVAWRGFAEVWGSAKLLPAKFSQPCEQVTLDQLKKACRDLLGEKCRAVLP